MDRSRNPACGDFRFFPDIHQEKFFAAFNTGSDLTGGGLLHARANILDQAQESG